jgi:imidazolonepropionase-like amidohydrolase
MRIWLLALALVACGPTTKPQPPVAPGAAATEYRGGRWFDGTRFVEQTMWVVGDRFTTTKPARDATVVDLAGGFVVPPFAEGHNHWLEPTLVDTYIAVHLRQGIFYVKDMSTPPVFHDAIRAKLNKPDSVDYVAAHQGFTGPGGHPIEIVDQLAAFKLVPEPWAASHGDGDALFVVTSEADIERVWPKLVASKPDFVKLFLIHSEDYAARRDDPKRSPKERGIDPTLVPAIVSRAHAARLRVMAHIEDAHDFNVAIAAGADDIAHLPFVDAADREAYRIADADIRAAGARHATIATTLEWLSDAKPGDPRIEVTRDNLARLRAGGVIVTLGTDLFRTTAHAEADRIAALGLMTKPELLVMWCTTTPRAMFPQRDLGRFTEGAEASFLVLEGDPLVDFANTHRIVRWVKQGQELHPPAAEMPPMG